MPVLTIASSKGSPGKTAVAMLPAGRLAADGLRVGAGRGSHGGFQPVGEERL